MQEEHNGQDIQTVWFDRGSGGLELLRIYNRLGEATIYLHGAHIASYKKRGEAELLFMSPHSVFEEGRPMRGGIPICFPWFGQHPDDSALPLHGFVRTMIWRLESQCNEVDGSTTVTLVLSDTKETRSMWDHRFSLALSVNVGSQMKISLEVTNTGGHAFDFSTALHTYYAVGALKGTSVDGLDGTKGVDRLTNIPFVQKGRVTVEGAYQHLYCDAGTRVLLHDPLMARSVAMEQTGWANILIWNPGEEAARANKEILDAWQDFLCVEHVNNDRSQVHLEAGDTHHSELVIGVAHS
jgi:glucose-6-phosphate 1-epimerase